MVQVNGTFLRADGEPDTGRVTFRPAVMAVDDTPDPYFVTTALVKAILDDTGSFSVDVVASDDEGWALSPETMASGGMPYIITIDLSNSWQTVDAYLPDPGPWDLASVVVLDAPPDVTVYPSGSIGPEGPVGPEGPPGPPGGSVLAGFWLYGALAGPVPVSGEIRDDGTDPQVNDSVSFWLNDIDEDSLVWDLSVMSVGDEIHIRSNSGETFIVDITNLVDSAGYTQITGTMISRTGVAPIKGQSVQISVVHTPAIGGITDHGDLTGRSDDDHTQYALADGSRGAFATTAQGSLADTALQDAPSDGSQYARQDGGWAVVVGGGGVTAHGDLSGLGAPADDHPQYLTEARHDALDHTGLTGVGSGGGANTYFGPSTDSPDPANYDFWVVTS